MATNTQTTSYTEPVPDDFWGQIDHQLARIRFEKPGFFAQVRDILLDPVYDKITLERNRNFERDLDQSEGFFTGSGGNESLASALQTAGWELIDFNASYYYSRQNTRTGEMLTYIEGDVLRGRQIN